MDCSSGIYYKEKKFFTQPIKQIEKFSSLISKSWALPVRFLPSSAETLLSTLFSLSLSFQPETTFLIRTASSAHPLHSLHSTHTASSVSTITVQWRLLQAYGPYHRWRVTSPGSEKNVKSHLCFQFDHFRISKLKKRISANIWRYPYVNVYLLVLQKLHWNRNYSCYQLWSINSKWRPSKIFKLFIVS